MGVALVAKHAVSYILNVEEEQGNAIAICHSFYSKRPLTCYNEQDRALQF